mgnify:CR=1 FL=1
MLYVTDASVDPEDPQYSDSPKVKEAIKKANSIDFTLSLKQKGVVERNLKHLNNGPKEIKDIHDKWKDKNKMSKDEYEKLYNYCKSNNWFN